MVKGPSKNTPFKFSPRSGSPIYDGERKLYQLPQGITAEQYRADYNPAYHWLYNPWTGTLRDLRDIETDPYGILIVPPGEEVAAADDEQQYQQTANDMLGFMNLMCVFEQRVMERLVAISNHKHEQTNKTLVLFKQAEANHQEAAGKLLNAYKLVLDAMDGIIKLNELRDAVFPIPMILHCPNCHTQHIDEPEKHVVDECPATGITCNIGKYGPNGEKQCKYCGSPPHWTNPPHRSHKCSHCKIVWRVADVATTGVAGINTRGEKDTLFFDNPLTEVSDKPVH
jgi:hypothetical protein